ncbi:MAG: hypothetical protein JWP67_776 [Mucilaginibacter sp.]|nr:hypothetical protein [Mucilaginibacter sp.]
MKQFSLSLRKWRIQTRACLIIVLAAMLLSCQPKIYEFQAIPLTIGANDSILLNWKVKGEPKLIVHDQKLTGADSGVVLREFTLVVQKKDKEIARKIQVRILPDEVKTQIVFKTKLNGDTLVAAGINSIERWGDAFVIKNISSTSERLIRVAHENRSTTLLPGARNDTALEGTTVKGHWEFRSLLTANEKANHSLAPDRLSIQITVKHK